MIRRIHLHDTGNRLNQTKDDGQDENKDSDPERVPLDLLPSIVPPLGETFRLRVIESPLYNRQSLVPVREIRLDPSVGAES